MKLVYCPTCKDLFKLTHEWQTCKCGKSSGRLLKDGLTARINQYAVPVGIAESTLVRGSIQYIYGDAKVAEPVAAWVYADSDLHIQVEADKGE